MKLAKSPGEAKEIATKTVTEMASEAVPFATAKATARGRHDVHGTIRNGSATATRNAGCLMEAATPTTSAPSHQCRYFMVSQMPSRNSPVIWESLWAPPMKSITRIGLSTENQLAAAGLTPTRLAIFGTRMPIRATPTSAGTRIRTAERNGSSPARMTIPWLIHSESGP